MRIGYLPYKYRCDCGDGVFVATSRPEDRVETNSKVSGVSVTSVRAVSSSEHIISRQQDAATCVATEELKRSLRIDEPVK